MIHTKFKCKNDALFSFSAGYHNTYICIYIFVCVYVCVSVCIVVCMYMAKRPKKKNIVAFGGRKIDRISNKPGDQILCTHNHSAEKPLTFCIHNTYTDTHIYIRTCTYCLHLY